MKQIDEAMEAMKARWAEWDLYEWRLQHLVRHGFTIIEAKNMVRRPDEF